MNQRTIPLCVLAALLSAGLADTAAAQGEGGTATTRLRIPRRVPDLSF
jgi:hypothetical protein